MTKKGYRKPVVVVRLIVGDTFTAEHIATIATSEKLGQVVIARISYSDVGADDGEAVIFEARAAS